MRLINVGDHMIGMTKVKHNCKLCYARDQMEHQVVTFCLMCNVPLCCNARRNCFQLWHSHRLTTTNK